MEVISRVMLSLAAAPLAIIVQAIASTAPAVVYMPPAVPPPPPQPGSAYYAEQRVQHEAALREQCYSEKAVKMILERQDAARAPNPSDGARKNAIQTELATAADAQPQDENRFL